MNSAFLPVMVTWHGKVLVIGTLLLGLLLPLLLHAPFGLPTPQRTMLAAIFSLLGGFVLRYAMQAHVLVANKWARHKVVFAVGRKSQSVVLIQIMGTVGAVVESAAK